MANDQPWRWWIGVFCIPIFIGVGGLYMQYLQYIKDIDKLHAEWEEKNTTALKQAKDVIDKKNKTIQDQKNIIDKLNNDPKNQGNTHPQPPSLPTENFLRDINKYLLSDLAEPKPTSWTDQVSTFIAKNWKVLLVWGVILVVAMLSKK